MFWLVWMDGPGCGDFGLASTSGSTSPGNCRNGRCVCRCSKGVRSAQDPPMRTRGDRDRSSPAPRYRAVASLPLRLLTRSRWQGQSRAHQACHPSSTAAKMPTVAVISSASGVALHEALFGQRPFAGNSLAELAAEV